MNTPTLSPREIALRAYHIYLDGGSAHGRDWEHWFQAEKELGARYSTPPATKAPAAKAPAAKTAAKKATAKKAPAKKVAKK
jgi:hypothetical protein